MTEDHQNEACPSENALVTVVRGTDHGRETGESGPQSVPRNVPGSETENETDTGIETEIGEIERRNGDIEIGIGKRTETETDETAEMVKNLEGETDKQIFF